jgi:hypothetical protein
MAEVVGLRKVAEVVRQISMAEVGGEQAPSGCGGGWRKMAEKGGVGVDNGGGGRRRERLCNPSRQRRRGGGGPAREREFSDKP